MARHSRSELAGAIQRRPTVACAVTAAPLHREALIARRERQASCSALHASSDGLE